MHMLVPAQVGLFIRCMTYTINARVLNRSTKNGTLWLIKAMIIIITICYESHETGMIGVPPTRFGDMTGI